MEKNYETLISSLEVETLKNKSKVPHRIPLQEKTLDTFFFKQLYPNSKKERWLRILQKILGIVSNFTKWYDLKSFFYKPSFPKYLRENKIHSTVIAVPHFSSHDAVCNDIMKLYSFFKKQGLSAYIYAESSELKLQKLVIKKSMFYKLISSQKTRLIYVHCNYWPKGFDILARTQGPIWFRYHNITPPDFFSKYAPISAYTTRKGRQQTQSILSRFHSKMTRYLPVSIYNAKELLELKADPFKLKILAPFHNLEEFKSSSVDLNLQQSLRDGKMNILFVGRVAPNKGFEKQIHTLHSYIKFYGPNVRMIFAGSLNENFKNYYYHLLSIINNLGLSKFISWTGKISFKQLHTLYKNSDAFLLLSDHEGFCLPILEAQSHGLPVIAVKSSAIQDSLGKGQLCLDHYDPELLATTLHRVYTDKRLREALKKEGFQNIEKYSIASLETELAKILQRESSQRFNKYQAPLPAEKAARSYAASERVFRKASEFSGKL